MSISDVLAAFEQTKRQNEQEQQRRKNKVYQKIPQLKEIHKQLEMLLAKRIKYAILGEPTENNEIKQLQQKSSLLLEQTGFAPNYLEPIYNCHKCHDTGFLPDSGHCECFKKMLLEDKLDTARLTDPSISFERFSLDIFDDTPLEQDKSQRDYMVKYKQVFEQYANSFPNCVPILLFAGSAGLGKTYCAKCIMRCVIERGYTAALYTAYRLFSMFHAHRLGENIDLEPIFEVPLLIVDDLGTEPMTKNVTIEYFFDLLNERLSANRHTIVATNLGFHEIKQRYDDRIHSRLMDKRLSQKIIFKGKDLRY